MFELSVLRRSTEKQSPPKAGGLCGLLKKLILLLWPHTAYRQHSLARGKG